MSTQLQLTNISISISISLSISSLSEIGSVCATDDRCINFIPFSTCIQSVCVCVVDYVPNFANVSCLQGEDKIVCVLNSDGGL